MPYFYTKEAEFVLKTLKNAGFKAYLVGGCVRDMLLNIPVHDYDITTSAKPDEVVALFENTVSTGAKHGTITVLVEHIPIEVTTFRCDGKYADSRRPDEVIYVSDIKYDLSRRDFTVNALAYNKDDGLIDLFGGKTDLENRILKAVGDPKKRFLEDALRILRLFRFASVLDFSIEQNTLDAALECSDTLKFVSRERIFSELTRAVCGVNTSVLNSLLEKDALEFLGIKGGEDLKALALLPENSKLRLFAFLYLTKSDSDLVLKELKASNKQKNYCAALKNLLTYGNFKTKEEIKTACRIYGEEEFYDFTVFKENILNTSAKTEREMLNEIKTNREPYLLGDLKLNGNDLKQLGFMGEEIKLKLEELLEAVTENPKLNKKPILLKIISKDR
ncbi:MAG: CCA tRNA nucleotidyltransferase [Ruminococcaceae bacterium]|nr:CCA tRNA nucleotidyltransferase [Oscillospiraceae bacterium]